MNNILVIMPIYNTASYLRWAIESVLQQKNVNVHLVMVDDCSTDRSLDIAIPYSENENVTLIKNETNRGTYYSRNRGLDLLKENKYDFFTVHDSDDISDVERYSKALNMFHSNKTIMGLQTSYIRLEQKHIVNNVPDLSRGTYRTTGEGIAIYRKHIFDSIGYYDDTRFSGDTDYWMRTNAYCNANPPYCVSFFKDPLYIAIKRDNNLSAKYTDRRKYWNTIAIQLEEMKRNNDFKRQKFD